MIKTTLRSHIYIVNSSVYFIWMFVTLACLHACMHAKPGKQQDSKMSPVVTLDSNKDGKPDSWKYYEANSDKNATPTLLKEEVDLNYDGKVDLRKTYKDGALLRIDLDLDFDGQFDREETYENGTLKKAEISHSFSKKKDTWKFYDLGVLSRVEKDTNNDGLADEWIYYENQQIQRVGKDYNFDGTIDHWTENTQKPLKKL